MEQQRDELRRLVLAEIERLKTLEAQHPKETYRHWHAQAVQRELARQQRWIRATYPKYEHFFATGLYEPDRLLGGQQAPDRCPCRKHVLS